MREDKHGVSIYKAIRGVIEDILVMCYTLARDKKSKGNVTPLKRKYKSWSPREIEYLEKNHRRITNAGLCLYLNRSKQSVTSKLHELKLKR